MIKASDFSIIFITAGTIDNARQIARALVESKLAACCSIFPGITSIYEWENKIEESPEIQLIVKTKNDKIDAIEKKVLGLHTYDVPEIISLQLENGHPPYLDWINSVVDQ